MGTIRIKPSTGTLFLDYRVQGERRREYTSLHDSPANRKLLQRRLVKLESGSDSPAAHNRGAGEHRTSSAAEAGRPDEATSSSELDHVSPANARAPLFETFANDWYREKEPEWRRSYRVTQRGTLDKHLIPEFVGKRVDEVTKADILAFRSALTRSAGRASSTLSNRRINAILKPLRQILNEAADRHRFASPFRNIKPLKVKRTDVQPFTLAEAARLIEGVRPEYKAYLTVRLFTGMRTGEINGLKWKHVDFDVRLIYVRESLVLGEEDDVKTDSSHRDIVMSDVVFRALQAQRTMSGKAAEYVFCNTIGGPLDNKNFVNRVWKPLLAKLGLAYRRPYQMRHTAATVWLAAGEAPEWIARQLGHTTTEMLFRTYSRFVPNLTRRDGSAMDSLIRSALPQIAGGEPQASGAALEGLGDVVSVSHKSAGNEVGQVHVETGCEPV